ncbi:MAG TPA: DUF4349 domain-containing protein, partial [Polyangiaceae bacterium]|nr:DUF4349 domain-containing protein [Polyangiaceae bacterium]
MSIRLLVICACLWVISGCAADRSASPPHEQKGNGPGREVVMTVDVDLRAKDVEAAAAKVRTETERVGGYVEHGTLSGDSDDRRATYDLRIPKTELGPVRKTIAALGHVESENETADDVTEQHADTDARLRNAETHEQRLLEVMAKRAGSVSELVETEKELARVREEVEKLDAEKRTLDAKIAMATVHVSITRDAPSVFETPGRSIAHAFFAGLHGARALGVGAAIVIAAG